MIEMQNVSVKYIKDFYAVFNFNATIDNNTILLGENGKIVLRLLTKMDDYSGNIFYDSINLRNIKNGSLPFAYLPEQPVLFKYNSIYKNLIYPLKIRKIKNAKQIVENAIAHHLIFLNDAKINTSDFNKLENQTSSANKDDINKTILNEIVNQTPSTDFNIDINKTKTQNQTSSTDFNKVDINQIKKSIDYLKRLKVCNLNKVEQQILCLLRAVIRQPKYLLIDNLFSSLAPTYHQIAATILSEFSGTIVAHENKQYNFYKNFKLIKTH